MAKLLVMLDGVVLREVHLSKDRTTIGRRSANDVVIDTPGVSGRHAVVCRSATHFFIDDLGSTNGTLVNGEPVKDYVLQFGDRIQIGEYRLKFVADDGPERDRDIQDETAQPVSQRLSNQVPSSVQIHPTGRLDEAPTSSWPRLRILSGPTAGHELKLKNSETRLGRGGRQIAVVTRRSTGYCIAHLKGEQLPMVNGKCLASATHLLLPDDIIEVAGVWMQFLDGTHSVAQARRPEQRSHQTSATAT